MSVKDSILEKLEKGEPTLKITTIYPWPSIPLSDREALLQKAEDEGIQAESLIRLLNEMTCTYPYPDKWDSLRVKSLCIRYLDWDENKITNAMCWMENQLNKIHAQLSSNDTDNLFRYNLCLAEVNKLKAQVAIDQDLILEAIKIYELVFNIYKEINDEQSASDMLKQIQYWNLIREKQYHLFPLNNSEILRTSIQQEIMDLIKRQEILEKEEVDLKNLLSKIELKVTDLSRKVSNLNEERESLVAKLGELNKEYTKVNNLKQQIEQGINPYLDDNTRLHYKLDELNIKLVNLQNTKNEYEIENNKIKQEYNKNQEELRKIKNSDEIKQEEINRLNSIINGLTTEINKLRETNTITSIDVPPWFV